MPTARFASDRPARENAAVLLSRRQCVTQHVEAKASGGVSHCPASRGPNMLGMTLTIDGHTGEVDAQTVTPDGKAMVRINDHWLMVE